MLESHVAPARGTRPRNRRDLIVAAASELFAVRGYANVSMGDVAIAVNVQPSALYRHFAGKQELLREVVSRGTRLRHDAVLAGGHDDIDAMLKALAGSALESRSSTRLWSVEVRHVEPAVQAELRGEVRALPEALARRLLEQRPSLTEDHAQIIAWAALDVLASISFHDEELPARDFRELLAETMSRVIGATVVTDGPELHAKPHVKHPARRERLIAEATRLLAARGYGGVRLEDIAAAAGMSTAGLYTYVGGKSRLLELVVVRAAEALAHAHVRALARAAEPVDALAAIIETYLEFAWSHPDQLGVLLTEVGQLDDDVQDRIRQTLDDVDTAWLAALQETSPGGDPVPNRIRVRAAQMIALDVLSTPSLRARPGVVPLVRSAMRAVLDLT